MGNKDLISYLSDRSDSIAKVAAANIDHEKVIYAIGRIAMENPAISKCDPKSVIKCAMTFAELGLYPSESGPYVVPYGKEAKADLGAVGWMTICHRSNLFEKITARVVREGEEFWIDHTKSPPYHHRISMENLKEGGQIFGAYVHFIFRNGQELIHPVPKPRLDEYQAKSKGSAWRVDYQGMCIAKTIKEACKSIAKGLQREHVMVKALEHDVDDFTGISEPQIFETKAEMIDAMLDERLADVEVEQ